MLYQAQKQHVRTTLHMSTFCAILHLFHLFALEHVAHVVRSPRQFLYRRRVRVRPPPGRAAAVADVPRSPPVRDGIVDAPLLLVLGADAAGHCDSTRVAAVAGARVVLTGRVLWVVFGERVDAARPFLSVAPVSAEVDAELAFRALLSARLQNLADGHPISRRVMRYRAACAAR